MLAENTIKKRTDGKKQNKIVARIRARSQKRKEFDSCRESQGWPVKSCVQHGIVSFFFVCVLSTFLFHYILLEFLLLFTILCCVLGFCGQSYF